MSVCVCMFRGVEAWIDPTVKEKKEMPTMKPMTRGDFLTFRLRRENGSPQSEKMSCEQGPTQNGNLPQGLHFFSGKQKWVIFPGARSTDI